MPDAFRVIEWDPSAGEGRIGHPSHVPITRQGLGRIDNPDIYGVLYASRQASGAVAEQFGWLRVWSHGMFRGRRLGDTPWPYALCRFALPDAPVLDLDDPRALAARELAPSRVVTRDRTATQRWARAIHQEGRWVGVSWWSYFEPDWTSIGIWDQTEVVLAAEPELLHPEHDAVREAADILNRSWR